MGVKCSSASFLSISAASYYKYSMSTDLILMLICKNIHRKQIFQ